MRPKSRGALTLVSADPRRHPKIVNNYLVHPKDQRELIDGVRHTDEIIQERAWDGMRGEALMPDLRNLPDAEVLPWLRANIGTQYHPASTCRMGNDDLSVVDEAGRVREVGRAFGTGLTIGDIARSAAPAGALAGDGGGGLAATARVDDGGIDAAYGLVVAAVAIDAATGIVRVERAMIAAEAGNAINPRIVGASLSGGVARGVGAALLTGLPLSAAGLPLVNGFAEYAMPTAAETPPVEVAILEDAPSTTNPLGVRDVAGLGAAGIGAAIAAAVDDALGAPLFATVLPVGPAAIRAVLARRTRRD
jgi:CO/xanthine dehydrogenase Mo-binding subunit